METFVIVLCVNLNIQIKHVVVSGLHVQTCHAYFIFNFVGDRNVQVLNNATVLQLHVLC
jgi:hypothetical protein